MTKTIYAFIEQSIGEHIYTIPEVVKEIRDKATLQRLQVLPYKLEYRTPSQESLQIGRYYVVY